MDTLFSPLLRKLLADTGRGWLAPPSTSPRTSPVITPPSTLPLSAIQSCLCQLSQVLITVTFAALPTRSPLLTDQPVSNTWVASVINILVELLSVTLFWQSSETNISSENFHFLLIFHMMSLSSQSVLTNIHYHKTYQYFFMMSFLRSVVVIKCV